MNLEVASEKDSESIIQFYNNQVESGYFDYHIDRRGSFFTPYQKFSDDSVTYILKDNDESVHAVATLTFREGTLNGEKQMIGYATDLQVSTNRKAILNWSNHFLPILMHEREKRNCKYVFTVVTKAHRQAYNAFIRPRSPKRKLPRYHLFRKFQLVSLHGRMPFAPEPLETIATGPAVESDLEPLAEFIVNKTNKLPLHYSSTAEDWIEHFLKWDDLSFGDFIVSKDSKKNIIGCTLPWTSEKYQRIVIHAFKGKALSLQQALKFFSLLGLTRNLPSSGTPFQFRYLTHFYFDNPDIFNSLMRTAWNLYPKEQFLTYCHFADNYQTRLPKSYIKSRITCGLYCLMAPEDPVPDFLKLAQIGYPPEFEPFLM